ncbi:MAG: hypothetical protein QF415_13755 [Candidatus Undinarchaeales archaeon]|nr:hypothetical protein [Candidatus Undinarchaeales archaeon]
MEIDFYEVPGTGNYVCTSERVHTTGLGRFVGINQTYDLFTKLNDDIAGEEGYGITLHTSDAQTESFESYKEDLASLQSTYEGKRNSDGFIAGMFGLLQASGGATGIGVAITAWMGTSAYFEHQTASKIKSFKEHVPETKVETNDALAELRSLYTELYMAGKRHDIHDRFTELSGWRKLFPDKEFKEFQAQKLDEITAAYSQLTDRSFELARETGNDDLKLVASTYSNLAKGHSIPLIFGFAE